MALATATACRWPPESDLQAVWTEPIRMRVRDSSASARLAIVLLSSQPTHPSGPCIRSSLPRNRFAQTGR